jgi:hypothetical protein
MWRSLLPRVSGSGALPFVLAVVLTLFVASPAPAAPSSAVRTRWSTVTLGPFVLPAAPVGAATSRQVTLPVFPKPCGECIATAIYPRLVYAGGPGPDKSAGVVLHHVFAMDPARRAAGCAPFGEGVFGFGDDMTPTVLPAGYGIAVRPDNWAGALMLMNWGSRPRVVSVELNFAVVPANTPGMHPLSPVVLNIAPCRSNSEYDVPAGPSSATRTWTSTISGRVISVAAHLHPGATGAVLENLTTHQTLCFNRPTYGQGAAADRLTRISKCAWDSLGVIRKGDRIRLTVCYDPPRPLSGVMGSAGLRVEPTSDLTPGTAPPPRMTARRFATVPEGVRPDP